MIVVAIIGSLSAIVAICWLVFSLATFALPAFMGVNAGIWAFQNGAGIFGGIVVGLVAAAATFGIGQFLLVFLRPTWAKLLVALAFVVPAVVAGYAATHGIVKHLMPSETWQIAFSVLGAIAIGTTALLRLTAMAPPEPAGQRVA
ncbi:hypothetical protein [Bosea vestrisii]|uniref:DUF4175 domain-containing protein n=1 Tax=Bosea vestrisii TaxID=151416 RepID=A0ABW0HBK5_9HYPH